MSNAAVTQLHPPTGVDACCAAHFTRPYEEGVLPQLIVARRTVLEVYSVRAATRRLEVAARFPLHGVVTELAVLRRGPAAPSHQLDAVLLAFKDARLACVEWDAALNTIRPSSLHCWEAQEPHKPQSLLDCMVTARPPTVIADPEGRCAAFVLNDGAELAIIPAVESGFGAVGDSLPAAALERSYTLNLRELGVGPVRSAVFLHGYNEPVIVLLHQPVPTWAARLQLRRDTCHITAFSLNVALRRHPVIWGYDGLPYDCSALAAVPEPIGGVLVFAPNWILHRGQGCFYNYALNDLSLGGPQATSRDGSAGEAGANGMLANPPPAVASMVAKAPIEVEIHAPRAMFLNSTEVLVSMRTGVLLTLRLISSVRGVAAMDLARAGSTVPATSLCLLGEDLMFVGSHVGDSLLVSVTEHEEHTDTPRAPKRARLDGGDGEPDEGEEDEETKKEETKDDGDLEQDDELRELYGNEAGGVSGKGGAYQGGKRAHALHVRDTIMAVGPVVDMAVRDLEQPVPEGLSAKPPNKLEVVAAVGQGRTGALAMMTRGVQPEIFMGVELPEVHQMWTVHHVTTSTSAEVAAFHAYLIISLDDSTMVLETGDELNELTAEGSEYYFDGPTIAAGNVFRKGRIVQVHAGGVLVLAGTVLAHTVQLNEPKATIVGAEIEDPYVLLRLSDGRVRVLYADEGSHRLSVCPELDAKLAAAQKMTAAALLRDDTGFTSRALGVGGAGNILCACALADGGLELYAFPTGDRVFTAAGFSAGEAVLGGKAGAAQALGAEVAAAAVAAAGPPPQILTFRIDCFGGGRHERPLVTAVRGDGTLLVYRGFIHDDKLRFSRVALDGPRVVAPNAKLAARANLQRVEGIRDSVPVGGVVVCADTPLWLVPSRGRLYAHVIRVGPGMVRAFAPFHNVNCEHGFLVATPQDIQFCQLPSRVAYNQPWPTRKVALKCTPHAIEYLPDQQVYMLATSRKVPMKDRPIDEEDMHGATIFAAQKAKAARTTDNVEELHELRLLAPGTLETTWKSVLEPAEVVLTMVQAKLRNLMTGAMEPLVVVGTAFPGNEDAPCRGRILVFSVHRHEVNGLTKWTANLMLARQVKSACTVIAAVEDHLLVANGAQVTIQAWAGNDLKQAAFFDTPFYVTSAAVVKNFILVGDYHKGTMFLHWRANEQMLEHLGKDFSPMDVRASEFLLDGGTLSLVAADLEGNMHVFEYRRDAIESWRGQKLLVRSAAHVGTPVQRLVRLKVRGPKSRFATLYGTLDGAYGLLSPVGEASFQTLKALQERLATVVPQTAGLNPEAHRTPRQARGRPQRPLAPVAMLDGDLLARFHQLAWAEQHEVMNGATRGAVASALAEVSQLAL